MIISNKNQFINLIKNTLKNFNSRYVIIKPNWVSITEGEYTEPEILDWLLSAFPKQEKIIVESYTPWRGFEFKKNQVGLRNGKKYLSLYEEQDKFFLEKTGIIDILKKHQARYINITKEFWQKRCLKSAVIKKLLNEKNYLLFRQDFFYYIPTELFKIRDNSIFISLAKIKTEESIPSIKISLSLKNIFGLLPHPSREIFHKNNNQLIPKVVNDLYCLSTKIFPKTFWINEGIKTWVKNYREKNQEIIKNQGLLFFGKDGKEVDRKTCQFLGINWQEIDYLKT